MRKLVAGLLLSSAQLWAAPVQAFEPVAEMVSYIAPQEQFDAMPAKAWRSSDEVLVAQGISSMLPGPGTVHSAGGGYTGPGDVVASAVGWWGLRAYNAAYATALGNAIEVCTAADALCTVIHVTATGGLNSSDLTTSGCSAITTCTAKTLYDQSGNGHNCTQATIGNRYTFDPNKVSTGKPSLQDSGGNTTMACASVANTAVPWSFVMMGMMHTTPGGNVRVFIGADPQGILAGPGPKFELYAGSVAVEGTNLTLDTFYAVVARTDGSGSGGVINRSGTVTSSLAPGSNSTGGGANIGGSGLTNNGSFSEGGIWASNFSTGDTTSMVSNIVGWWGI